MEKEEQKPVYRTLKEFEEWTIRAGRRIVEVIDGERWITVVLDNNQKWLIRKY